MLNNCYFSIFLLYFLFSKYLYSQSIYNVSFPSHRLSQMHNIASYLSIADILAAPTTLMCFVNLGSIVVECEMPMLIKGLRVVHLNTRSLLPKIDLIRNELLNKSSDIFSYL